MLSIRYKYCSRSDNVQSMDTVEARRNTSVTDGKGENIMNVGVIGSGAISDIYLKNMIERFDKLNVLAIASRNLEHAKRKTEK